MSNYLEDYKPYINDEGKADITKMIMIINIRMIIIRIKTEIKIDITNMTIETNMIIKTGISYYSVFINDIYFINVISLL